MRKYRIGYVIGRMQPFHRGHAALIDFGLQHCEHVIVLVGGCTNARSAKNPWTYEERRQMIEDHYGLASIFSGNPSSVKCVPLPDFMVDDDAWDANTRNVMAFHASQYDASTGHDRKPDCLVGFNKDWTSKYLCNFPDLKPLWKTTQEYDIDATAIRDAYFGNPRLDVSHLVPDSTASFLDKFWVDQIPYLNGERAFKWVKEEHQWYRDYKYLYRNDPFPPHYITTDAFVTKGKTEVEHVLCIVRKNRPGAGLYALPGGFCEAWRGDSFKNCLAELREETGIRSMTAEFIGDEGVEAHFTGVEKRYDNPSRFMRGYTLTTVFGFHFVDKQDNSIVFNADDDAQWAGWRSIDWIWDHPELFFDDHWHIIQDQLKLAKGRI